MQEKAGELAGEGKSKLADTLDRRTTEAGMQARSAAQAMRETGGQMRADPSESDQIASVMDAAADRIEQLGSYLERTSGDRLVHDVERFARRQPWLMAGIGLVAGLAASRFLKASSERRYASHSSDMSRGAYRPDYRSESMRSSMADGGLGAEQATAVT